MIKTRIPHLLIIIRIFFITFIILINPSSTHPVILIILIIIYTILISLLISTWSYNFIYSIILFLIIIRGLLIIFLYFSRLISNEQNKISIKPIIFINLIINILIIIIILLKINFIIFIPYNSIENNSISNLNSNLYENILKIYFYPYTNLLIICLFYLLISLFSIIKISSIKSSPLRKII